MKDTFLTAIKSKQFRSIAGIVILVVSIIAFTAYAFQHPQIFSSIGKIGPTSALLIILLYFGFILTTAYILSINVEMCRSKIERREGFLLTAYSTIVNFFGPLQSGPGFRAVYLKKRLGIKLRDYTIVTLFSYMFFALFSGVLLISSLFNWPILVVVCVAGAVVIAFIWKNKHRFPVVRNYSAGEKTRLFVLLAIATLVQIVINAIIYFVELQAIDPSITFGQAVIYTGAANFALFASLTPGAIGIRESFLLFSQSLHGIDSQTILAASVIDRALYFVFLGALFLLITSMHAQKKLRVPKQET